MIKENFNIELNRSANDAKFILIKLGGNALIKESALFSFSSAINQLVNSGCRLIITHGGGPQITAALENAGIESKFVDGFRYTSSPAIKIVKDILCGEIQNEILSSLRKSGVKNITAICGDEDVICAEIKTKNASNKDVDLGYVGDVSGVHTDKIISGLDAGSIVVLSAIGKNEDGTLLNINADSAAAALAAALKVDELILLTDVDGVFSNWPDKNSLISDLTLDQALDLMPNLAAGMLPKLEAAIIALKSGVPKVRILNGSDGEALLISQSNNTSIGTVIS